MSIFGQHCRLSIRHLCSVHKVSCQSYASATTRPFPVLRDTLDHTKEEHSGAKATSARASEELAKQTAACHSGGGEKAITRHTKINKKVLVRDRLKALIDPGTDLFELCTTTGLGLDYGDVPCGGVVAGVGTIGGTKVIVSGNDGTVKGGTFYPITVTKSLRIQDIARKLRLPTLYVADTGGAFLPLQSELFPVTGGRSFGNQAIASGMGIPQIALVSGLCTAGGAYNPTMCDVAVITHRIGNIYLGGPPLVKAATGEVVTGEELGGATMHCSVSGITDHFAQDEEDSFTITRDVIASLNIGPSPDMVDDDPPLYSSEGLEVVAGQDVIDREGVTSLLARITDGSRFHEFKTMFGGNLICGFSHLKGQLVGWVVNCGPLTGPDSQKGAHFVQLCDTRDVPIVFLQNSSNSVGEICDAVTMKERAKMIHMQSVVRVPKITLNVGGSFGDENYTMCGPSFDPHFYFMWPRAKMSKTNPAWLEKSEEAKKEAPKPDPAMIEKLNEIEKNEPALGQFAKMAKSNPSLLAQLNKMTQGDPANLDNIVMMAKANPDMLQQVMKKATKPQKPKSEYSFSPDSAAWAAARTICDGIVDPLDTRDTLARAVQLAMINHLPLRDTRGLQRSVVRM